MTDLDTEGSGYAVLDVVDELITSHKKDLTKAFSRKTKAMQTLAKADRDIDVLSGAIMALEDIKRRFEAGVQPSTPAVPQLPELPKYVTLAGDPEAWPEPGR